MPSWPTASDGSERRVQQTAALSTYFASTAVIVLLVLKPPPYRSAIWLSSHGSTRERRTRRPARADAYDDPVAFVPDDFQPPHGLAADGFLLEPLGPEHNEADHEAWSSSIEHIRATPGYPDGRWPRPMSREENRADLERHARDFAARSGFTYTVLDPSDRDVIGCVYIYPDKDGADDAVVQSWVRATHARRDGALRDLVARWLAEAWPFERISYAGVSGEA